MVQQPLLSAPNTHLQGYQCRGSRLKTKGQDFGKGDSGTCSDMADYLTMGLLACKEWDLVVELVVWSRIKEYAEGNSTSAK